MSLFSMIEAIFSYKNMTSNIGKCIYWQVIYCIDGAYCVIPYHLLLGSHLKKNKKAIIVRWFSIP